VTLAPAPRAPDNELFDRGCDLVEAAVCIRRAADAPEAARAIPAVLGCVEAALRELLGATAELEQTTARTVEHSLDDLRFERMLTGYGNLQTALADAERAASAARSLAGRALDTAGAV
jgi:hypothetical protein